MKMNPVYTSLWLLLATLPVVSAELHYYFIGGGVGIVLLVVIVLLRCCLRVGCYAAADQEQPRRVVVRRRWTIWRVRRNTDEEGVLPDQEIPPNTDPPSYTTATEGTTPQPPPYSEAVDKAVQQPGHQTTGASSQNPVATGGESLAQIGETKPAVHNQPKVV